jgi:hypothetical protein
MSDQLQNLKLAVQALLAKIDVSTDCMSNQIKRENIDEQINVLEAIVETIGEPMPFQVQELRPEVLAFALLMEQRLREKDADKGQLWKDADIGNLQVCVTAKNMSLDTALMYGTNNEAARHAVDIANYCMMIADVAGALEQPA